MKIIFLDVDGVLNSNRTVLACGGYPQELAHQGAFDQIAIGMLQALCRADKDVKIVLSSAWRLFNKFEAVGVAFGLPIIDRTPALPFTRGHEIQQWLDAHPEVEAYVIVDDDPDMLEAQAPNFVRTDACEGFSYSDYCKVCEILNVDPWAGKPRERNWNTSSGLIWAPEGA